VNGAENGAERAENRVSGNGAVSGHTRKRLSGRQRSVGREVAEREQSGEQVSQNRLERWAANRPLTVRSQCSRYLCWELSPFENRTPVGRHL